MNDIILSFSKRLRDSWIFVSNQKRPPTPAARLDIAMKFPIFPRSCAKKVTEP